MPWTRLPALRRIARATYDGLGSHRSWLALWLRFLTHDALGPLARVVRLSASAR